MLVFMLASATMVQAQTCGIASWYGPGFHGKATASGQEFNSGNFTAAHRTLSFGTKITVTNQYNGKKVTVTVNDRGPFVHGRILDLSEAAARQIGIIQAGTGHVCF